MSTPSFSSLIANDQLLRSMPNVALALFLLYERTQSNWNAYIDILPSQFNTPLYFTAEQLNKLKRSNSLCKIFVLK